jgi:hypothetical protein
VEQSEECTEHEDETLNELRHKSKLVQHQIDDLKKGLALLREQKKILEALSSHEMDEALKNGKAYVEALELACKELQKYEEMSEKVLETEKKVDMVQASSDQEADSDGYTIYLTDL